MKFLLEILGMTNQCNLRCTYCDWVKEKYLPLGEKEINSAKRNIENIRKIVDEKYPELQLIEYSGGEPFMYPEILEILLETFKDKWIRIITNGLLVSDDIIHKIKKHGKTFLSLSLDGHKIEANYARFQNNEKLFQKVLNKIDKIVENKIPLMILCTISKYNIDYFPKYIQYLQNRYSEEIAEGMLVLPAHYVSNYSKENGIPDKEQAKVFTEFIRGEGKTYPIIHNIYKHYENLAKYAENNTKLCECRINEWNISMHFRGNEIIQDGKFLSFGCGMRGVMENGLFNVNDENDIKKCLSITNSEDYLMKFLAHSTEPSKENRYSGYNDLDENCFGKCFVDWTAIDLIINGIIDYEEAEKWFVLFKDENIKKFCKEYSKK